MFRTYKLALIVVICFPSVIGAESLDVVSSAIIVNDYSGLQPKGTVHVFDETEASIAFQSVSDVATEPHSGTGTIRVEHSPNAGHADAVDNNKYGGQVVIEPYDIFGSSLAPVSHKLVIDPAGVGLSTDDPEFNLHISDDNVYSDGEVGILMETDSGTSDHASGRLVVRHSNTDVNQSNRGQIVLEPEDVNGWVSNALVVDPAGVGIGTIPTSPFDVYDYMTVTDSSHQLIIAPHAFNFNGTNFYAHFNSSARWIFKFGGTEEIRMTKDGISYDGGNTFITSDIRRKTEVKPLENSIEKLQTITPISFKYKKNNSLKIGLSAQEVEKVYPELVIENEKGIKALDYSSLVAPLLGAVKEQQEIIEKQEDAIAQLKNQLNGMVNEVTSIRKAIDQIKTGTIGVKYQVNE